MPKIKNIIIFISIGAAFVLIYTFFIKGSSDDSATLVSSGETPAIVGDGASNTTLATTSNGLATADFLNLLLSVKSIKLDDSIFSDKAFISLRDSSIVLVPDGNEGRINPFAQLGGDAVAPINPPAN